VLHGAAVAVRPGLAVDARLHAQVLRSPISSAVVMKGPKALPVSKSLPLAGPSWPCISTYCSSRAEKSLKIV
jgi:hypothetical protein